MNILFGVFDWGLGHATRDTPIIEALLAQGHTVDLLSTGRALTILRDRFGEHCRTFDVPSIAPPYVDSPHFVFSFATKLPKMAWTLMDARRQAAEVVRRGRYDLVISDCRYDVFDRPENSILINHQLRFHAFWGGEQVMERWLAYMMRLYRCVVVPDYPDDDLSGRLSHSLRYFDPGRIRYIGILSHVRRLEADKDLDYFISLTGPEPQRSRLERRVREQVARLPGKIVVAGGNPDSAEASRNDGRIEFHAFLPRERQEEMMNRARCLVSRSGYTTMMELCEVGLPRALLIPTPGQTEQVYLADYHARRGTFPTVSQYELDLERDVARAEQARGFTPPWRTAESVGRFLDVVNRG